MNKRKVCIIGGGVSGLSSAYYLKKKGYTDVTVYEKEDRVGGQVYTSRIDNKEYDMSAFYFAFDSPLLMEINTNVYGNNNNLVNVPPTIINNKTSSQIIKEIGYLNIFIELLMYTFTYLQYIWLSMSFTNLFSYTNYRICDLYRIPLDKLISIEDYGNKFNPNGFINKFLIPFCGSFFTIKATKNFPITYLLKILTPYRIVKSLITQSAGKRSTDGYQNLWIKLGKTLNIKSSSNVTQVNLDEKYIIVNNEHVDYDALIVNIPLSEYINILTKNTQFSNDIFSSLQNIDESIVLLNDCTFVCETKNLSTEYTVNGLEDNLKSIFWYTTLYANNVYIFLLDMSTVEKDAVTSLFNDVKKLGGEVTKILMAKEFLMHIITGYTTQKGFYQEIEKIQGKRNIYLFNQVFSGSPLIECCIEYAYHNINKYF
jgi:oxygen-dependent protoporphyrinogen oxidase